MIEKIKLEGDESVLLQVRKHWFVLALQIVSIVLIAILPIFIYILLIMFVDIPILHDLNGSFLIALYTGWLIIIWMMLFNVWTNYYLDVWTITNKRLIAVDQKGFFSRSTASFRLERLQDIIVSVNGFVATLLDYGNVELQTAGEERNFKATGLPSPADIKSTILSATDTLIANGNTATTST